MRLYAFTATKDDIQLCLKLREVNYGRYGATSINIGSGHEILHRSQCRTRDLKGYVTHKIR